MTINGQAYRELRCKACRKLICYEYVFAGRIAFTCPRCGEITEVDFKHLMTPEVKKEISEKYNLSQKGGE